MRDPCHLVLRLTLSDKITLVNGRNVGIVTKIVMCHLTISDKQMDGPRTDLPEEQVGSSRHGRPVPEVGTALAPVASVVRIPTITNPFHDGRKVQTEMPTTWMQQQTQSETGFIICFIIQ